MTIKYQYRLSPTNYRLLAGSGTICANDALVQGVRKS